MQEFLVKFLSTGFGVGYFPIAPGTAGTLLALLLYYFFFPESPSVLIQGVFLIIMALFFAVGVWSGTQAEAFFGHDPSCVVIDEIVGMWLTLFLIPKSLLWLILGFGIFRVLDISKWLGAQRMQSLKGGWGIMMDDVVSGVWSNLILQSIVFATQNS